VLELWLRRLLVERSRLHGGTKRQPPIQRLRSPRYQWDLVLGRRRRHKRLDHHCLRQRRGRLRWLRLRRLLLQLRQPCCGDGFLRLLP